MLKLILDASSFRLVFIEAAGCCVASHPGVKLQVVLFRFTAANMSKWHGELTQREQELLRIRRDSDTKATELAKMEKILQQTKTLLDKKVESGSDSLGYQENMGLYHKKSLLTSYLTS